MHASCRRHGNPAGAPEVQVGREPAPVSGDVKSGGLYSLHAVSRVEGWRALTLASLDREPRALYCACEVMRRLLHASTRTASPAVQLLAPALRGGVSVRLQPAAGLDAD
jgi:hypothetical protein